MGEDRDDVIEMQNCYRYIFSQPAGRRVFNNMILRSGFLDDIDKDDAETLGKRNFMLETVKIIGSYSDNPEKVSEAILIALLNQPLYSKE